MTGDGRTVATIPIDNDHNLSFDHTAYFVFANNLDLFYVFAYDRLGNLSEATRPALRSAADAGLVVTVNPGTDVFTTAANHGLVNGSGPYLLRNAGGSELPGNTQTRPSCPPEPFPIAQYWVEVTGNRTFKLHTESANGPVLNVTTAGTGTLRLVREYGGFLPAEVTKYTEGFPLIPYAINALDSI